MADGASALAPAHTVPLPPSSQTFVGSSQPSLPDGCPKLDCIPSCRVRLHRSPQPCKSWALCVFSLLIFCMDLALMHCAQRISAVSVRFVLQGQWGWLLLRGHSLARLKPGGPQAIRTPEHPDGLPSLSASQVRELTVLRELREFSRELLSLVAMRGGMILFENPVSSLTWKTRGASAWTRGWRELTRPFTPYLAQVAACQHGMNALKHWLFCSNHPVVLRLACSCPHDKGTHPALSGKRSADGTFLTRLTALYPESLASAIAFLLVHL